MSVTALVVGIGCVQILTLILCGVLWWQLQKQELIISRLSAQGAEPAAEPQAPQEAENSGRDFASEYREAEIRASLQTAGAARTSPTEKYKYVACMADKGVGAEDLAQSFGISSYEAEQLMNLSRLANGSQG